jgi:putative metallohydrolase (TIGR04338 family)
MRLGTMQAALYEAQGEVTPGRTFTDVRQVRQYVEELLAEDWFQLTWPEVLTIHVERRGSGARWSCASESDMTISLAREGMTERTVLHEVAHLCVGGIYGHNATFCRGMLTLVRRQMGFHAYGSLLAALRAQEAFSEANLDCVDMVEQ